MKDRQREKGKQEKQSEKASREACYTAVTPLWCSSKWERLSTHYSSDLGGQLEESSINQTDAQAEVDDSRQQCSQQPPPAHTYTFTHLQPSSHTYIYLPACPFICIPPLTSFIHTVSLFVACSFYFCLFYFPLITHALYPLWISSYKQ